MPHQRSHEEMNLWCNCEKQECQVFHYPSDNLKHKHGQCEYHSFMSINGHQAIVEFTYLLVTS